MVRIPEGPFYLNVDDNEAPGGGTRDVLTAMPAFSIDRTEVVRAAFNAFGAMSKRTGDAAAPAGLLSLEEPGKESLPIVGVTFPVARDYCRFLGKDLPTIEQWQKAVRGGVNVGGLANPAPKREVPWLGQHPRAANLRGEEDGAALMAAPGSFPADLSPYGVVDLAGNVSEWTLSVAGPETKVRGLRLVGGANWDTPPDLDFLEKVTYRTTHPDLFLDFALGLRCASVTAP
jgi:formylglycine-generating enzyme required for sulfatase activity